MRVCWDLENKHLHDNIPVKSSLTSQVWLRADLHAAAHRTERTRRSACVGTETIRGIALKQKELVRTVGKPDFRPVEQAFIYLFVCVFIIAA